MPRGKPPCGLTNRLHLPDCQIVAQSGKGPPPPGIIIGYPIAVYQLCFVMTIFHMTTPMDFYSVNGWNIPIAAGLFFLWVLLVSITFVT